MQISKIIKQKRKQYSLSQQKLSSMVGVTRNAVQSWETGENTPTISNLRKLEKILSLGVLTDDFITHGVEQ